jgi:hypothetical protein
MSDVTLSSGREITFDLYQISLSEFRNLLDPARPNDEGDAIIGRAIGMTAEQVEALPYPDYRRIVRALFERARNPLDSPNLESASTLP